MTQSSSPQLAGTITLESALPDLSDTTGLTEIKGPGAASLTVVRDPTMLGFSVFTVDAGVKAKLAGLTVTGGVGTSYLNGTQGGGINNQGNLTITGCTIAGNHCGSDSYGGYGGGIYNSTGGSLLVMDSTVRSNYVQSAINSKALGGYGGGIYNGMLAQS